MVQSSVITSSGVSQGSGSVLTLTPQDAEEILRQCPAVVEVAPIARARAQKDIRDMAEATEVMASTSQLMGDLLLAVALISLLAGGVGIMNEVRFSEEGCTAASTLAVSRMDRCRGRVAWACVSEASIFATQWAKVLAEAIIADPVDPLDEAVFADWLRVRRKEWATQLDSVGLAWFERYSLPQANAEASLLWVQVLPLEGSSREPATYQLLAFAVGDSVLFHYREGKLLQAFPAQNMAELRRFSTLLSSRDLGPDSVLRKFRCHDTCAADDLLVLCNGTTAAWALRLHDFGLAPA